MKVERPREMDSQLWIRVKMASMAPTSASSAGTKLPTRAMKVIKPTWAGQETGHGLVLRQVSTKDRSDRLKRGQGAAEEQPWIPLSPCPHFSINSTVMVVGKVDWGMAQVLTGGGRGKAYPPELPSLRGNRCVL